MKKLFFFLSLAAMAFVSTMARCQAAPAASEAGVKPELVILDTDIGDDIDDAFALALVLRSPELKLVGITTAFGDTDLRAKLVGRYLGAVCRFDVNVVPGAPTPHQNVFTQAAYAHGAPNPRCARLTAVNSTKPDAERLKKQQEQNAEKSKAERAQGLAPLGHLAQQRAAHDAAGFILDQIRAHPGEITLIAIGPLFNVQAAIERDPDTFRKLKRVVMMGGSIKRGYDDGQTRAHRPPDAEWNIKADPAGAKALLASGVPVFMMPLDSTQIRLEAEDREAIFAHGSPLTDQLTLLYHQWSANGHWTTPTLFDPVAVAYAVRPELCPTTPMHVDVDAGGFTRPLEGDTPNVEVCLQSDEKGFLRLLLDRMVHEKEQ